MTTAAPEEAPSLPPILIRAGKIAADRNIPRALRRLEALYESAVTEEDREIVAGKMEALQMERAVRRAERAEAKARKPSRRRR